MSKLEFSEEYLEREKRDRIARDFRVTVKEHAPTGVRPSGSGLSSSMRQIETLSSLLHGLTVAKPHQDPCVLGPMDDHTWYNNKTKYEDKACQLIGILGNATLAKSFVQMLHKVSPKMLIDFMEEGV